MAHDGKTTTTERILITPGVSQIGETHEGAAQMD